jgi:HK97 family phage major capsid protein
MLLSDTLKQSRASKAEEAQGIYAAADTAKRAPTAEEITKFDALMTEVEGLNARIDGQLKIEAALKDKPAAPPNAANPKLDDDGKRPVIKFKTPGNLKAFRASTALRPSSFDTRQDAERAAYASGKWMQAALFGNKKAEQWCLENGVFSHGADKVIATEREIFNVHEEGTNETGGFLVPDEFERAIYDIRLEYGVIRQWATVTPMMSDYKVKPKRTGTLTAYPVNESAAFTESTKSWGQIALTAKKWGVLTKWSTELNEDAVINMGNDLAMEAGEAFAYAEDNAAFNGDASANFHGITGLVLKFFNGSAASYVGAVTTATHDTFAEIDGDDLDKVVAALPQFAGLNRSWYIGPVGKALVFDPILRAAGGNTQTDVAAGAPPRYLGYPIRTSPLLPNLPTEAYDEDPMLFFGDMSKAIMFGDRRGVTVQILKELYAANGQLGLIASERFDINVHNIGDATTAGPLVAYIGETS